MEIIFCHQLVHQRLLAHSIGRARRKWKREMRWYPIKQNCVYSEADRIYKETLEKYGEELYKEMAQERRLNKRLFSEKKEFDIDLPKYGNLKKVETTSGEYGHLPQYKYESCMRNVTLDKYTPNLYKELRPQEKRLCKIRRQELERIIPNYADSSNHEYGRFPQYEDNRCGPCPRKDETREKTEVKTKEEKELACQEECQKKKSAIYKKILGSQEDILKKKPIYPETAGHEYGRFLQFAK